jgi:hypothetical protein
MVVGGGVSTKTNGKICIPFCGQQSIDNSTQLHPGDILHLLPSSLANLTGVHPAHITHPNDAYYGVSHDGGKTCADPPWAAQWK